MARRQKELTKDLKVRLWAHLSERWRLLNQAHFGGRLIRPLIVLDAAPGARLRFEPHFQRAEWGTIWVPEQMVLTRPFAEVLEAFKEAMAHEYVHAVERGAVQEVPLPTLDEVCRWLSIDPDAVRRGRAMCGEDHEEARVLSRVRKLLCLAESSNTNEAELAMAEARRLMLKHNLGAALGDSRYGFRHLGEPRQRVSPYRYTLSSILRGFFFVRTIWVETYDPFTGRTGQVLEILGTEANLEMAVHVHDFLIRTGESLWQEHKRQQGIRSERGRRDYLAGVMTGFEMKLLRQESREWEEGLVWSGDAQLKAYDACRHPSTTPIGRRLSWGNDAGVRAGMKIEIHRPIPERPTSQVPLLGPATSV